MALLSIFSHHSYEPLLLLQSYHGPHFCFYDQYSTRFAQLKIDLSPYHSPLQSIKNSVRLSWKHMQNNAYSSLVTVLVEFRSGRWSHSNTWACLDLKHVNKFPLMMTLPPLCFTLSFFFACFVFSFSESWALSNQSIWPLANSNKKTSVWLSFNNKIPLGQMYGVQNY